MMKLLVPTLSLFAALTLAGCSGDPPVTKAEEEGFKNPSKTPPPGFTVAPPHGNVPPPPGATPSAGG